MSFQTMSVACCVLLASALTGLYHAKAFRTINHDLDMVMLQPRDQEATTAKPKVTEESQQPEGQQASGQVQTNADAPTESQPESGSDATQPDDGQSGQAAESGNQEQSQDQTPPASTDQNQNPTPEPNPSPQPESQPQGQCPAEGTVSTTPDEYGNCQCKDGHKCFDDWIMEEEEKIAKELDKKTAGKVLNLTKADMKGKNRNCAMHAEKTHDSPQVSTVFFMATCEHCKCMADAGSDSAAPRGAYPSLATAALVLATSLVALPCLSTAAGL